MKEPLPKDIRQLPPLKTAPANFGAPVVARWAVAEARLRPWDQRRGGAVADLAYEWALTHAYELHHELTDDEINAIINACVDAILPLVPPTWLPGGILGLALYELAWLIVSLIIRYLVSSQRVQQEWAAFATDVVARREKLRQDTEKGRKTEDDHDTQG